MAIIDVVEGAPGIQATPARYSPSAFRSEVSRGERATEISTVIARSSRSVGDRSSRTR